MAFDKDLKLLVWNKMFEQTTKMSRDKVLGRQVFEVFPRLMENKKLLEGIHQALAGEPVFLPTASGPYSENYYDIYYVPLRNDKQQVYAVLNGLHDITEKEKVHQELETLNRTLHQKNHELKSMTNSRQQRVKGSISSAGL